MREHRHKHIERIYAYTKRLVSIVSEHMHTCTWHQRHQAGLDQNHRAIYGIGKSSKWVERVGNLVQCLTPLGLAILGGTPTTSLFVIVCDQSRHV